MCVPAANALRNGAENGSVHSPHSYRNQIGRFLWRVVWLLLYRPSPRVMHSWRRFLLRLFGASIGEGAHPYPTSVIWAPWKLEMGDHSCLGDRVDCYCVDTIRLGANATVSQYTFLCTASHDYCRADMPLVTAPITIEANAWVAADVFIGPGVTVGCGAIVGARSTVLKDVQPMKVVAGNPPRVLRERILTSAQTSEDFP